MIAIGSTVLPLNFSLASNLQALDGKPIGIGSSVAVILPADFFPVAAYAAQGLDHTKPSVLSVQPDGAGTYQPRAVTAVGAYETFTLTAQGLFICPDSKTPYVVPFVNPGATS
jgi:hypothetical protein